MIRRFLTNYIQRHQNRWNQFLHLIGLPVTFLVPVVYLIEQQPNWAAFYFVLGYLFQFWGHAIEGNDAGEIVLIKKSLGRPYVEFGPSANLSKNSD